METTPDSQQEASYGYTILYICKENVSSYSCCAKLLFPKGANICQWIMYTSAQVYFIEIMIKW